jgi:hypothetical protein
MLGTGGSLSVIMVTLEAENRKLEVQGQPREIVHKTL